MLPMRDHIRSERLTLRLMRLEDFEALRDIWCRDEVKSTYMLPDLEDAAAAADLFRRYMSLAPGRLCYAVCLKDRPVGFIHEVRSEGDTVEVGYAFHPDHWGRGYAAEALRAVIAELFRMGAQAVTAGCFENNPASGRVMEKCGMVPVDRVESVPYRGEVRRCLYRQIRRPHR